MRSWRMAIASCVGDRSMAPDARMNEECSGWLCLKAADRIRRRLVEHEARNG
jgi:hypothetical protein